jgi:hypothetical protein
VSAPFTRSYRLPFGFVAEFSLDLADLASGFACDWTPHFPVIHANRARRKFFDAYAAARADFLQDAVQMIGGSAVVVDTGERAGQVTVIEPRAVQ